MLPPAFKASSFPFPHSMYILHSQGLFVLYFSVFASEASGRSAPLCLCNEGINKSREGVEVFTVLRPTTAVSVVPSLDAQTLSRRWAPATAHTRWDMRKDLWLLLFSVFLIPRAAWALGSFHHMVLPWTGGAAMPCEAYEQNCISPSAGHGNLLCYSSQLPNNSQTLWFSSFCISVSATA